MQIQLSVSVLISDRPGTASKCLNSLLPILQNVPSELIVVYTGKEKESLEIAKRYTDHIISFDWCDDFSKARNVGLAASKGQWFMYIDDDEWFENCEEIVKFFKTGEFKSFHSACYLVRNYDKLDGKSYSDSYATRMVERRAAIKFTGLIHERFNAVIGPTRCFDSYAHHYGYATKDGVRSTDRKDRNIPLLKEQLEREPDGVIHYVQIAQEYFRDGEYEQTEHWCRKILAQGRTQEADFSFDWAAVFLIRTMMADEREEEALNEGAELLKDAQLGKLYLMELYIYLTAPCFKKGQYETGVAYGRDFIRLKKELEDDPETWNRQQLLLVNKGNILKRCNYVYSNAILCAILLKDFDSLEYFLKEFSWDDTGDSEKIYQFWDSGKRFFDLYHKEFLSAFSKIDSDNSYVLFQKALYHEMNEDYEKTEELYIKCQEDLKFFLSPQLILMAIRNDFTLPNFMNEFDLDDWRSCAQTVAEKFEINDIFMDMENMERQFKHYPLHIKILQQKILSCALYDNTSQNSEFIIILGNYCDVVLALNRFLYREELFGESMQFCLPKECRISISMQRVLDALSNGAILESIENLKELVHKYPDLAHIARRVIDYIHEEFSDYLENVGNKEFYELGQKVKAVMKKLAENEQYSEALSVAVELGELLPGDAEVVKYKQQLRKMVE